MQLFSTVRLTFSIKWLFLSQIHNMQWKWFLLIIPNFSDWLLAVFSDCTLQDVSMFLILHVIMEWIVSKLYSVTILCTYLFFRCIISISLGGFVTSSSYHFFFFSSIIGYCPPKACVYCNFRIYVFESNSIFISKPYLK